MPSSSSVRLPDCPIGCATTLVERDGSPSRGACDQGEGPACLTRANASPTDTALLGRLRLALDRNLNLYPHDRELLGSRGLLSMLDGRDAEGLADYDRLLEMNPGDAAGLNNRAWLKVITSDFAGARADADRSVELHASANAFGTRCFALAGLGELEKARADCTRASKMNPADHFSRGMLAFFDKHEPEARREWALAVRGSPSDGRAVRYFLEKMKK